MYEKGHWRWAFEFVQRYGEQIDAAQTVEAVNEIFEAARDELVPFSAQGVGAFEMAQAAWALLSAWWREAKKHGSEITAERPRG